MKKTPQVGPSCSLAFNGNSVFCLQIFNLWQKHSSLSSLARFEQFVLIFSTRTKKYPLNGGYFYYSGAEGFEPPRWLDQNQLPYHLATPQYVLVTFLILLSETLLSIIILKFPRLSHIQTDFFHLHKQPQHLALSTF